MTEQETLLTFPCEFTIKIFGKKNDEFETNVISIIHSHCKNLSEDAFTTKPSKDNNYLSISAKLLVDTKEQLDTIYKELSANPNVIMVL